MGTGTDVAIEIAGVILVKGDSCGIVKAIRLSRAVVRNINQNLLFAFGYNSLGIPIAAGCPLSIFRHPSQPDDCRSRDEFQLIVSGRKRVAFAKRG